MLGPHSSPSVKARHSEIKASFPSPIVGDSKDGQQSPSCMLVI